MYLIFCFLALVSCQSIAKHKDDFKPIAHDMIDEVIDDSIQDPDKDREEKRG